MAAKTVDEAQKAIDELLNRVMVDYEVPDFRRASQDNDIAPLKESPIYADFVVFAQKFVNTSLQQRRAELKRAKYDTESRKVGILKKHFLQFFFCSRSPFSFFFQRVNKSSKRR